MQQLKQYRGDGRARLRDQLPERFPVEAGEGKGDAAGLAEGDDPPPIEVEQLVQFHQIAGHGDERRGDDAPVHQIHHRQQQERLVRAWRWRPRSTSRRGHG